MHFPAQICAVNLVVRDLESSVVKITPDLLTMESETVLTQYIIMNWTLAYNNISKHDIKRYYSGQAAMFLCRRPESRDPDDDYSAEENHQCNTDDISAHLIDSLHCLCNKLLQRFLL